MGPGGFFPTNPNLADVLGIMDVDFDIFYYFDFLDPRFLDFQVHRSSNSKSSRFLDAAGVAGGFSDPNLTPLPTHPRIK